MDHLGHPNGPSTRSAIRRRSGAISANDAPGPTVRKSSRNYKNSGLTIQVEDVDLVNGPPTVILVPQARSTGDVSVIPRLSSGRISYGSPDKAQKNENKCTGLMLHMPKHQHQTRPNNTSQEVQAPQTHLPPTSTGSVRVTKRPCQTTSLSSASLSSSHSKRRPTLSSFDSLPRFSSNLGQLSTDSKLTAKFPISRTVKKLAIDESIDTDSLDIEGLNVNLNRWTAHKWWLFLSVLTLFCYGAATLSYAVLTWLKAWEQAEVMYVADYDVLVLITLASSLILLTFATGITGTLLNSRPILAVYALLLWPALISILAVGYVSYKRSAFALDRKLNLAWSQWYTPLGRLVIQDTLRCCGYSSPLHQATASSRCYARSPLPGCKGKLLRFEKANLQQVWTAAFSVVPLHILNIFVSLLCANHVTKTFGKGIMPRQYRLKGADVQADAEKILGALRRMGPVVRPTLARAAVSATFREDKADDRRTLGQVPASLRPGNPPGLSAGRSSRKLE